MECITSRLIADAREDAKAGINGRLRGLSAPELVVIEAHMIPVVAECVLDQAVHEPTAFLVRCAPHLDLWWTREIPIRPVAAQATTRARQATERRSRPPPATD